MGPATHFDTYAVLGREHAFCKILHCSENLFLGLEVLHLTTGSFEQKFFTRHLPVTPQISARNVNNLHGDTSPEGVGMAGQDYFRDSRWCLARLAILSKGFSRGSLQSHIISLPT